MTIADISRERFADVQETTFGAQVTAGNLQTLRIESESLKQTTETTTAKEIRSDRQVTGVIRTRIGVAGAIQFALSYGSYDDYFARALHSPNVKSQGLLTIDTLPTDDDTMVLDGTTYTFKDTMATANDIQIEAADLPGTVANVLATINGTGTAGTNYFLGTVSPHLTVRAGAFSSDDSIITALYAGEDGDLIATTETFTAGTNIFDGDTLGTTTAGAGWTAVVSVAETTISAASGDNSFNDSGSGFGSIVANQWIEVRGFMVAGTPNNCYCKVVSATAAKVVVSGVTLVTEPAGDSVTIKMGSEITNGTTKNSFNLERTYTELSNELALYVGCMVDGLSLSVGEGGEITGNFGIVGKSESSPTSSGGDGYEDMNDNEIMNSIDHVIGIYENQVSINLLDFTFTLSNNLRERRVIGSTGPDSFGADQVGLTGSFTSYYESKTFYDKYLNFTTTSLAKVFEDTAGNAYVIDMPEVKITDASRHAGAGLGDDFKVPATFQAFRDATEDITIRIVRFPA